MISHPFDKSFKVIVDYCPDLAFEYLNLPGNYVLSCKNNFLGIDSKEYFLDSVFLSSNTNERKFEDFIINLEHQSTYVTLDKLKTMNMYSVHVSYFFAHPVISLVLIDAYSYNKSIKEYKIGEDLIHKPRYIYFSLNEINEKLENLIKKHDLNETLNDLEAMDVAFLPIISPKHMRKEITKTLVELSCNLKIENIMITYVIVEVLTFMLKYYFKGEELIELLGMINMGFEEAVEKLFNGKINELNDELYQSHEKLKIAYKERDNAVTNEKLAKKERDNAVTNEKLAKKERDIALSDAKLAHEKNSHFIKLLNNLKKQGRITDDDLSLAGITL